MYNIIIILCVLNPVVNMVSDLRHIQKLHIYQIVHFSSFGRSATEKTGMHCRAELNKTAKPLLTDVQNILEMQMSRGEFGL